MKNSTLLLILFVFNQFALGQTTIHMQKEGGVFTIPCNINGLKLSFIFDTGASDVSISLTEALFMLKNGYLKSEDIMGKEYYQDATGSISVGTKIIIKKIEFDGIILRDVKASIVHQLAAPLLLGQSAMFQLGKFELDPTNGILTIINAPNNSIDSLAYNYMKQKNYPQAIIYYEKKIMLSNGNASANDYLKLGQCYYNIKNYIKADTLFGEVIRIAPTSIFGYVYRARCKSQLDPDTKQGLAKPFYEKVIEVGSIDMENNKKELIEASSYLGYYYLVSGEYSKAKEHWNKVLKLDPTNEKANRAVNDPNLK